MLTCITDGDENDEEWEEDGESQNAAAADWSHNSEGFEVTEHDTSLPPPENISHVAMSETSEEYTPQRMPFTQAICDGQQPPPAEDGGPAAAESKISAMCDKPESIELELSGDWPSESGDAGVTVPPGGEITGQEGMTDDGEWTEEEYTGNTEGEYTEEEQEEEEGGAEEIDAGMESEG